MRVTSWDDFDQKLREVALIDLDVTDAGRDRDLALIEAQTAYDRATATRLATREVIEAALEKFYRANRKEVEAGGKRSVELTFGRAGIRAKAATLRTRRGVKWSDVVARIKDTVIGWERFIQTKESVKKDEVKRGIAAGVIAEEVVGVTAKAGEEFFVETFPEKVERASA